MNIFRTLTLTMALVTGTTFSYNYQDENDSSADPIQLCVSLRSQSGESIIVKSAKKVGSITGPATTLGGAAKAAKIADVPTGALVAGGVVTAVASLIPVFEKGQGQVRTVLQVGTYHQIAEISAVQIILKK